MADLMPAKKRDDRKPVIAITGPQRGARAPRWCVAGLVRWFGGTPVQLRPQDDIEDLTFDGLVITGGHDVDPVLYAEEPEVHPNYDQERDAFEANLIDRALAQNIPLLTICRGAQLLNIRLGGNLHQDLRPQRRRTSKRRTVLPLKTLYSAPASQVAQLLQCTTCSINSLHNQAIDEVGNELHIVGHDKDGIVQAVEAPSRAFCIGVQWHPEFLFFWRRHRALFKGLLDACRSSITADTPTRI